MLQLISRLVSLVTAPARLFRQFLYSNPLAVAGRQLRMVGGQLRFLTSLPRSIARQVIPPSLRRYTPKMKGGGKDGERREEDLPDAKPQARGGRRRTTRGRRVKMAQRTTFTQIHLIETTQQTRKIIHIGSTVGTSRSEWIVNAGQGKRAIQLEFAVADGAPMEKPLKVSVLAGAKGTRLVVDGKPAEPSAFFGAGSRLELDGKVYAVELFTGQSLPAITRVDAAWSTNVGPTRDDNQDAIGIYQYKNAYMFTVADGVGGGYAGDEVSAFAVKYLLSVFKKNVPYEGLSWYDVYNTAYRYINREVCNWLQTTPDMAGTTLTSVFIRNWTAYIAHVGDSRIYLLRDGIVQQLTQDHNQQVEQETRNRAGYPVKVKRTLLQKAVGRTDEIEPDVFTLALQPKDLLLLATDGVTSNVEPHEIYDMLTRHSLAQLPQDLIELANGRGNTDNGSVVAVEVMDTSYERDIWVADPSERVYVGGPSWYLRLKKPKQMNTVYSIITQTGCFLVILALFVLSLIWAFSAIWGFFAPSERGGVVVETTAEPNPAATDAPLALTPAPTDAQGLGGLLNPLGGRLGGASATPLMAATATETLPPSPAPTATPSATPIPTLTPPPTATPLPSATPIPPTSTPRSG